MRISRSIGQGGTGAAQKRGRRTRRAFSSALLEIVEQIGERASINELTRRFGDRAPGALLVIFAIPNLAPLPPGASTVLAVPLIFIALQLALGWRPVWLPNAVGARSLSKEALQRYVNLSLPIVKRAERLIRPRFHILLNDRLIGAVCFLLALVLFLPIPFGNLVPALAIAALGLGLLHRDGLAALVGLGIGIASLVIVALVSGALILSAKNVIQWLGFGG